MVPTNPIAVYLPVSEIFPEVKNDFSNFKTLLSKLSLTDALFWCARLNLIISNPNTDHRIKQQYCLDKFFTREQIEKVNRFARQHGGIDRIFIFSRSQLLELIRWICLFCKNQPDDIRTFEKFEVRETFVKVALIANDIWAKRIYEERFSLEGNIDEARLRALGAIRQGITGTYSGVEPLRALGRGKTIICEHFVKFYPNLSCEFKEKTGLSLEEYYACLGAMFVQYLDRTPEKIAADPNQAGMFNVIPYMKDALLKYINLESQTASELKKNLWNDNQENDILDSQDYDYKPLRKKPIFRADDGRAIVLDPVFYVEKALVGPLFYVLEGCTGQKSNQIFGAYGNAFEEYVFNMLKRMYPATTGLADRLVCNLRGKDRKQQEVQIADACLNDVLEIILFEIKSTWIREDVMLEKDYKKYLEHLRKKYGISSAADNNDRSIKGVAQLARAINKLLQGEWTTDNLDIKSVKKIYPVLIVHDPLGDAPVYNNFLNTEFKEALSPYEKLPNGGFKKDSLLVTPLILMTIDDLENLETSIKYFSLRDLLRDYSTSVPDRIVSFHNYIIASNDKYKIYRNKYVYQRKEEVLNMTREIIY